MTEKLFTGTLRINQPTNQAGFYNDVVECTFSMLEDTGSIRPQPGQKLTSIFDCSIPQTELVWHGWGCGGPLPTDRVVTGVLIIQHWRKVVR